MPLRITPMRPIERNGLKGFGLTVFIDNSKSAEHRGSGAGVYTSTENVSGEISGPHSHSSRRSSPETDKTGEVASSSPASPVHPSSGA